MISKTLNRFIHGQVLPLIAILNIADNEFTATPPHIVMICDLLTEIKKLGKSVNRFIHGQVLPLIAMLISQTINLQRLPHRHDM